ncbi:class I SAM-dependent methyltransferase [Candidatus Roizmanbacteria bacterium]|nr:class I SAM-dependent methyltransferase [Candidatus Roizmanbacteria bacterium]
MSYRSARSLYNNIANKYHDNRSKATNDVTELPTVLYLLGDLKNKQLLDMGCGLGKHAKEFVKRGAIVTGYDTSEKMVKLSQEYCSGKGTFLRATHESVSFGFNSFDVVNASYTIGYSNKLDLIFSKVHSWLKPGGIFTFSIPHPLWLLTRVEKMDYSKPHKVQIKVDSYGIDLFNYYYPLDTYIQVINKNNFLLRNLIESKISRRLKGWPEEKYRIPNAFVFKVEKSS